MKKDAPKIKDVISMVEQYQDHQESEGYGIREWKFQGYEGAITEGQAWGQRGDSWCFQWSSHHAHRLAGRFKEIECPFNLTRVDYQVTTRAQKVGKTAANDMYRRVREFEMGNPTKTPISVALVDNPGNGWTCYLGRRSSPCFSRSYDKTAEQRGKVETGLIRHELQCNSDMAKKTYEACANSNSVHKFSIDIVTAHLQKHGITDEWQRDAAPMRMPSTYKAPDDDRFLEHFGRVYAKRVNELRRRGKLQNVLDALQLSAHVIIDETRDGE